ncbi:hypothetical protein [Arthrobacter sp. 135MFCol5.1]|uniref:hypothetical protein n=1 Tax=Arthrobacter sp. 135MFCol5.1 TaxID=1158050 RepID=UPI0018C96D58|nr:hypothetical protein [Arthrobacter sp. 135MFCol5.1]
MTKTLETRSRSAKRTSKGDGGRQSRKEDEGHKPVVQLSARQQHGGHTPQKQAAAVVQASGAVFTDKTDRRQAIVAARS